MNGDRESAQLLRLPEVKQRTGLSRSSIYAAEAAGKFPVRVQLGQRAVAWVSDEIAAWIKERIGARSKPMVA
ncbi:MAG: helix-turn-helix transcriptional regulator [Pseudomarimonas sp.]